MHHAVGCLEARKCGVVFVCCAVRLVASCLAPASFVWLHESALCGECTDLNDLRVFGGVKRRWGSLKWLVRRVIIAVRIKHSLTYVRAKSRCHY